MDDIGKLVRYGGARESVDVKRLENARARVSGHWQDVVAARRRSRQARVLRYALAGSLVAACGLVFSVGWLPHAPDTLQFATINRVVGDVLIDGQPVDDGDELSIGSEIETMAGGRLALDLAEGQSVRVDEKSRLQLLAVNRMALDAGGVYVDTGSATDGGQVAVVTSLGVATDVGTQFQVRLDSGDLQIGVREGLVELARPNRLVLPVGSGNIAEIRAGGEHTILPIRANDVLWSWVTSIPPQFTIEGATLLDYLNWYAREAGLSLEWETPSSRENAESTRLSGSIRNLSLDEGFRVVQRIALFDARVADSTLHIRFE